MERGTRNRTRSRVLRSNVDEIFPRPNPPAGTDREPVECNIGDTSNSEQSTEKISITSNEELDPLPSPDEIQSANADDVQLVDDSAMSGHPDSDALVSEIDPQPLNVGDILSTETDASQNPDIREPETGDSFEVDEASLLLLDRLLVS